MGKGSSFEREICRDLSKWWSNGKRDDIFWRTSISGGRATTRRKKGKATFGQDGDIQAVDPIGQPLLEVCAIEIKRGYSSETIANLIDKPLGAKEQLYEKFINQVIHSANNSNSIAWMLIVKRDRRKTIVIIPRHFYSELRQKGMESVQPPRMMIEYVTKPKDLDIKEINHKFVILQLSKFLKRATPAMFIKIAKGI
jgi:hypothetical protein